MTDRMVREAPSGRVTTSPRARAEHNVNVEEAPGAVRTVIGTNCHRVTVGPNTNACKIMTECARMTVPVLFVDLDFKVDDPLSATAWDGGLCHGSRAEVTPGVTVIVSDGQDAFFVTVESVSVTGPAYVIRWDQPIAVPALIHRPSHP